MIFSGTRCAHDDVLPVAPTEDTYIPLKVVSSYTGTVI